MTDKKLKDRLFNLGLIEAGNAADIAAFKTLHRAEYAQKYNREFKQRTKRKTLIFTPDELQFLKAEADRHSLKLSPFLKAAIFAYVHGAFVHPHRKKLSVIESLLREVNQRIAESIQYVHLSSTVTLADVQALKVQISDLERFVESSLNAPPRLDVWLYEQSQNDPLFLTKLLRKVAQLISLP